MKFSAVIFFALFLYACGEKKEEIPSDVIPEDKFIALLTDMYALEGKYSHVNVINKPVYEQGVKEYEVLFKKYGVTKKQVELSIDHYNTDPARMKKMLVVVLDSLNLRSRR